MNASIAAYTWEDLSQRKVAVTTVTELARQVAGNSDRIVMSRAQFRRFVLEFRKVCKHPAARLFAWTVEEDTLYTACCDCGEVLHSRQLKQPYPHRRARAETAKGL